MTSEISKARSELHAAIASTLPAGPWRVHRTTPAQIVAPTIYLDSVEMTERTEGGALFVVATFPVVAVVDGTVAAQIEALDDRLAAIWQVAVTVGRPTSSRPSSLDVGGPHLRAQTLRVDVYLQASTLCPIDLTHAVLATEERTNA